MPLFRISVSSNPKKEISDAVLKEISANVASILSKPENYVQAIFQANVPILFAGTDAPSAYVEIKSIGSLNPGNCKSICNYVSTLFEDKLNINGKRIYFEFTDVAPSMWGWDQNTFG
ncbi:MAG: macrophage migration inhibitory factor [uncultured bacterium]|nr:MAG: macrophage migration inhibitory factor [uncultured bacterium]